jgi:hypothetical protein
MANFPVLQSRGTFGLSKAERQVGQALAGIDAASMIERRRDIARIERITGTAEVGMLAVGRLGMVEAGVAQVTPHVMPELHAIRSAAAHGIAGVVYDAGRGS